MKYVIDISEKIYQQAKDGIYPSPPKIMAAIANSTPLVEICEQCEIGNPCLYCEHKFKAIKNEDMYIE